MSAEFLQRIRIILVGAESPGNIGAAARAIKTMGLTQLCIVAPACDPHAPESRWMGHNADDTLEQATYADSLHVALQDTVFSVATTQRPRRQHAPVFTPEEVTALLQQRAASGVVAIVFGRESSGLTNEEVALCSIQSTIPAATTVPSLNLAQAVMIYAYALFCGSQSSATPCAAMQLARHDEFEQLYAHMEQAFKKSGVRPATTMPNYIARFRRVLSRIPLESRDIRLLHNLLSRLAPRP